MKAAVVVDVEDAMPDRTDEKVSCTTSRLAGWLASR